MSGTLFVINPNSSETVTAGIAEAVAPLATLGTPIDCLTLAEGPPGIETQQQADGTIAPMLKLAASKERVAAGYIIACFSDPGLHALRDQTSKPVLGIQECAVATAMTLGQTFGVIAIKRASVSRHLRSFGAMGVMDRLAADRPLDLSVADLADPSKTETRMVETGRALRDQDGAEVLIMGCAGMARYRHTLETELGIPVVDPCQAAVSMAIGRIALDLTHHAGGQNA